MPVKIFIILTMVSICCIGVIGCSKTNNTNISEDIRSIEPKETGEIDMENNKEVDQSINNFDNLWNMSDIKQIFEIEDKNDFIIAINGYLSNKCEYGDNLNVLSSAEKVVYLSLSFEGEINNGGFNQFFYNSTGDNTIDTLNSLNEIGASKTYELLKRAISIFPDSHVPEDRTERQDLMEEILNDDNEELIDELDSSFYNYEDNLLDLNYNYIISHKDSFK